MIDGDSRLELPAAPRAAGIAREFARDFVEEHLPDAATPDALDSVTLEVCQYDPVTQVLDKNHVQIGTDEPKPGAKVGSP